MDADDRDAASTTDDRPGRESGAYFVGVGEAGGRLLDSILLRRETETDTDLRGLWDQIAAGYGLVGANGRRLAQSYYATEFADGEARAVAATCSYTTHVNGTVEHGDADLLEAYLDRATSWDDAWHGCLPAERLRAAQSTWFLHAPGERIDATPVLARAVRETVQDHAVPSPLLAVSILPDDRAFERKTAEAFLDVSRLASVVDAILPVQYLRLRDHGFGVAIDGFGDYRNLGYEASHETLVGALEILAGFVRGASGFDPLTSFDVTSLYQRTRQCYSAELDDPSATVLAPSIGRLSSGGEVHSDELELLLFSTLRYGRMIDFDPSTASGTLLLFCGPEESMASISAFVGDRSVHEILDDRLDLQNVDVGRAVALHLDTVHLLALSWNPRLPVLEAGYETAVERRDEATAFSSRIENRRADADRLLASLGGGAGLPD